MEVATTNPKKRKCIVRVIVSKTISYVDRADRREQALAFKHIVETATGHQARMVIRQRLSERLRNWEKRKRKREIRREDIRKIRHAGRKGLKAAAPEEPRP